jgi:hypothetical protein
MAGKGKGGKKKITETIMLTGIQQGAGKSVAVAFGPPPPPKKGRARKRKQNGNGGGGGRMGGLACWDAFHPAHLTLPRAVAPYTVIRTTAVWAPSVSTHRQLVMFGPHMNVTNDGGQWSSIYASGCQTALTNPRSFVSGWKHYTFGSMASGSWSAASVTPSAFSIQIMNPEALQTSSGMCFIGRCLNKVNLAEGDNTATSLDLANSLVAYSAPRLCSAGKLALRGIQVDAIPNNMSELAKFSTLNSAPEASFTIATSNPIHMDGFNPIFVYNPNGVALQILVCCEWRVRFDPSNPAYASCSLRKPASDDTWYQTMEKAVATGSGALDIVERVASLGRNAGLALSA